MKEIKGILKFVVWNDDWMVGSTDVKPMCLELFSKLAEKGCSHGQVGMNRYELKEDGSDMILKSNNGEWLFLKGESSFSNVSAYIEHQFQRLNGQEVVVSIDDNSLTIDSAGGEYPELWFTRNNTCSIPNISICRIGEGENCCIFLLACGDGFECAKFDSYTARMLLNRLSSGNINAGRIGDCRIIGRRE